MKDGILRDVVAGCAGVLVVAVVIGLPKPADPAAPWLQRPAGSPTAQHITLLPYYTGQAGRHMPQRVYAPLPAGRAP